jgi:hypothetical protein
MFIPPYLQLHFSKKREQLGSLQKVIIQFKYISCKALLKKKGAAKSRHVLVSEITGGRGHMYQAAPTVSVGWGGGGDCCPPMAACCQRADFTAI